MGRMLKNTVFRSGSYALGVPVTPSSGVGPDPAVAGQTRWNSDSTNSNTYGLQYYDGSNWQKVAHEGNVTITTKNLGPGDGTNVRFGPLNNSYSSGQEAQVLVHVGTVYQIPFTNYEFFGNTTIGFKSIPSPGAEITVIEGLASTKATLA